MTPKPKRSVFFKDLVHFAVTPEMQEGALARAAKIREGAPNPYGHPHADYIGFLGEVVFEHWAESVGIRIGAGGALINLNRPEHDYTLRGYSLELKTSHVTTRPNPSDEKHQVNLEDATHNRQQAWGHVFVRAVGNRSMRPDSYRTVYIVGWCPARRFAKHCVRHRQGEQVTRDFKVKRSCHSIPIGLLCPIAGLRDVKGDWFGAEDCVPCHAGAPA